MKDSTYTPGERVAHALSLMVGTIVERPTDRPDWRPNPEFPIVHWDGNSPHHFSAVPPNHLLKLGDTQPDRVPPYSWLKRPEGQA